MNVTPDKMVNEYLEHHRRKDSNDNSDFILEWAKEELSVLFKKKPALLVQGGLVILLKLLLLLLF